MAASGIFFVCNVTGCYKKERATEYCSTHIIKIDKSISRIYIYLDLEC